MTNPINEPKPEAIYDPPSGITGPAIDVLLDKVSSKYALAIFAAKRARQINSYYQQPEDGVFEYIGPLVTPEAGEKPLSIALREIEAGVVTYDEGK
ncbi:DNA-directed RNA polymerase subunit omega [Corynebacterium uterequi]|uniref:DNA-directed RNA polymerase subunit omega n=1 Tax=Corynebacterium uterequi TaxID=1072256 RepID=A0A0G3HCV0_9CORY|nr:DNA-directed RNA polymerase subunit omega [Corynebacterium uterequi]AKK11186.1 DNA-directed RNA polymerase, omega subunit [Corynebacterium uterequi]